MVDFKERVTLDPILPYMLLREFKDLKISKFCEIGILQNFEDTKMAITCSILKIQISYFTSNFVRRINHIWEARLNGHFFNFLLFQGAKEEGVRRQGGD